MQTDLSGQGAVAPAPLADRPAAAPLVSVEDRKVLAATLVGSAIEWYDYFISVSYTHLRAHET